MAEATLSKDANANTVDFTAPAALSSGEVIQLTDGRAGIVAGLAGFASGDRATVIVAGQFNVAKISTLVCIDGCKLWFDRSASTASPVRTADSFYLGTTVGDAAGTDSTVTVELNAEPVYIAELGKGQWTNGATNGLGVLPTAYGGSELTLAFDAVAEVAMAALYPGDTVPVADGPIFEGEIAIYDIGNAAALDISIGLANGTHATDFDAVTESAIFHLDGSSLSIYTESDDGSTEVAATDTTLVAVDDTYALYWIDARDLTDVKFYVNGVLANAVTHDVSAATGPLFPIVHLEKTSDDTLADVRVRHLAVRSTDLTS